MSENWLAEELKGERKRSSRRSLKFKLISYSLTGVLLAVVIIGVISYKPAKTVTKSLNTDIPASSTSQSPTAAPVAPNGTSSQSQSAALESSLAAQDKAMAAQNLAAASQAIQSNQAAQQALNSAAANCQQNPQAVAQANQAFASQTQITDQMVALEHLYGQGYDASSGLTFTQWIANYKSQMQQLQDQFNMYQQQWNTAKSEEGGC